MLNSADLIQLSERHNLSPHLYADDTQVCSSCQLSTTAQLLDRVSECLGDVATWIRSNWLQLNTAKTEVIWYSSTWCPLVVGSDAVVPVRVVRGLGIYLDSDLIMRTHVAKTVLRCFVVLRQLRSIWRSVSDPVLQSLVMALVLMKLYYGSATLAGLPAVQLDRLQSWPSVAMRSTAARVWNSLPAAMQSSELLGIFQCLKTELFKRSYACQTTLLLLDSLSLSHHYLLWLQPWSLSTIMLLWHSFLIIIIIIISSYIRGQVCSSLMQSRMLHGSKTWPVRKENELSLANTEMRMIRWMCGLGLGGWYYFTAKAKQDKMV